MEIRRATPDSLLNIPWFEVKGEKRAHWGQVYTQCSQNHFCCWGPGSNSGQTL
jgi:hypothetical protein